MKWLFVINDSVFLSEFLGKMSKELILQGDECLVVFNSKFAEFKKRKFFPKETKIISRVDWCLENYKENTDDVSGVSWKDVFPVFDRFKPQKLSFKEAMTIVKSSYQLFNHIFSLDPPDVIAGEIPPDIFHEIAYLFGKRMRIPYLGIEDSKFEGRIEVYDDKFFCKRCQVDFNTVNTKDISDKEKRLIDNFIDNLTGHKMTLGSDVFTKAETSSLKILGHYISSNTIDFLKVLLKYLKKRKEYKKFDYESESVMKKSLLAPLKRQKRQFKIFRQKSFFDNPDINDKFFFYPLPFQPESSTEVYATYYVNQIETVKNICFSLPFNYKLYVKEHPASVGLRHLSFYKKIKNIPNAVLLSSDENFKDLIEKSAGVITLTGTVGLEAALLGKKSYVLGSTYYNFHPMCVKLNGFSNLKEKIEEDLRSGEKNFLDLKEINRRFIFSFFKNTIEGNIAWVSMGQDTNNYASIINQFKKIIERFKTF